MARTLADCCAASCLYLTVDKLQPWNYGGAAVVPTSTWRSISKRLRITSTCWEWQGCRNDRGYGYVVVEYLGGSKTRTDYVHRVLYRELVGPIPTGMQIDHLCRNTSCANPDHLEPVTPLENTRRSHGHAAKTECPQGHPYDEENTYRHAGRRACRICKAAAMRSFSERQKLRSGRAA